MPEVVDLARVEEARVKEVVDLATVAKESVVEGMA